MFGFSACQQELASCSPMAAMLSPATCESAHLESAAKYPVSVGAAQRPSTVGCKRKAGRDQSTPGSAAVPLVDCLDQSGRPSGGNSQAFRPENTKRLHSLQHACSGTVGSAWGTSGSCHSECDLASLLDMQNASPVADNAGLLFCEEGLDVEEAGLCGGSEGDCSPRCFEDLGDDSLSMSASTSDSQHSEGSTFMLPRKSVSSSIYSSIPEEMDIIDPYAMSNTPSPSGSFIYRRIPDDSLIGCMAAMYGFTPFTISVGTSYFERLAAKDPTLLQTARSTPEFAAFVAATPMEGGSVKAPIGAAHRHLGAKHWLTAVHLACIYIAAKNVEFVPYKRLLSTMLSHIYNGEPPQDAAPQLELEVLHALEWRLGPFFRPVHAA
ncbi:hypothetical protein CVIRNUC_005732 [Coccomyxa viridis]|uniref:Cyclin N-terminal domain-containing protein n=1 Tax=Coccomyxa viridis TaxID=1274662 RepID=A0AAV1I668_9CHLO|nr:hypothetical protein CVIRNUC_005732 [Coccomyxa viridis]